MSFCPSVLEKKFLSSLVKLNLYLETPLTHELDENPSVTKSSRRYLDGDTLSLADCNLLPKLHIVKVSRIQWSGVRSGRASKKAAMAPPPVLHPPDLLFQKPSLRNFYLR